MRLTVLGQYAKSLVPCDQELGEEVRQKLERLKWALWHGNLYKALGKIDDIESLIDNVERDVSEAQAAQQSRRGVPHPH